jgi:tungstate transport system substrate-binding protein|tara:strand:- start:851 stop:1693 length:843 start_codon:yes stop_codon:yes gene_type:complete
MMLFSGSRRRRILQLLASALLCGISASVPAAQDSIVIQSTTSTANSGLYDYLLPLFEETHGIKVNVVAVGTGQAIRNAMRGDGDVLLVHAESDEKQFVADGWGVERFDLMFNDFVLVGPAADPAGLEEADSVGEALTRISLSGKFFASRGDDSGTHKKELALWRSAGIDPSEASGGWYRETGSGMGATLNVAVGMNAYCLTDRATWISFANKQGLRVLYEDDPPLFNQYGIILVDSKKHPHVKAQAGQVFVDWMIGKAGQTAIANFRRSGQQLFFPNASP